MDMLPFRKISCVTFSSSNLVRVLRRTNSFENRTVFILIYLIFKLNYLY